MDKEVLGAWIAEGLSLEQIGQLAGRHPSTVGYWVRKHGLAAAGRERHAARGGIDRPSLERLVAAGASVATIAAELDRSPATVRHWLRRLGLETRRTARLRGRRARDSGAELLEMRCGRHGLTAHRRRRDGRYRCLRCASAAVARRRRRVKRILVEEAGGRCAVCRYDRCAGALHFHHREPASKAFMMSDRGVTRSLERARDEARKCVLLCSNCHAEVENGLLTLR